MTATANPAAAPSGQNGRPFLYVVVCAAGIAAEVGRLITAAQERGWEVGVIATPVALGGFFDTAAVEAQTGRPIRSAWRRPGEARPFPPPDAVVVAPATFNTVNKWAAGLADTLAVGTLCEVSGLGVPVAVLPCVADALAAHPAYRASLERLRGMGVRFGDPYAGEGDEGGGRGEFRWERALDLLEADGGGTPLRP
ncbi:flavoprotein [Streptomyces sp. VNUA24]|uniref:flavoprotein n=1 Tax=Streptomyces sp. VNUA24 TaxID=3031131 RepID=UPI0023B7F6C1|nr:flavoprotein [Streptomyces sp. VNUA24]WEH13921.1 flavoprotein [Streptomyces sp. VNUA24]